MSIFQKTDWEGVKRDLTTPIEKAIEYLKQGDKDSAVKNIKYAQSKLPEYVEQLDRDIFEEVGLKIKKAESLVPINPEYIDSVIGLVSIKEVSNIEKRNIREYAMKSIGFLEENMRKSKIEDKTILDALKNYKAKIEEAISSDFVPEVDKALEKYGYKTKP